MNAIQVLEKKIKDNIMKAQKTLAKIDFDNKDMELREIDKKYESIKKQG